MHPAYPHKVGCLFSVNLFQAAIANYEFRLTIKEIISKPDQYVAFPSFIFGRPQHSRFEPKPSFLRFNYLVVIRLTQYLFWSSKFRKASDHPSALSGSELPALGFSFQSLSQNVLCNTSIASALAKFLGSSFSLFFRLKLLVLHTGFFYFILCAILCASCFTKPRGIHRLSNILFFRGFSFFLSPKLGESYYRTVQIALLSSKCPEGGCHILFDEREGRYIRASESRPSTPFLFAKAIINRILHLHALKKSSFSDLLIRLVVQSCLQIHILKQLLLIVEGSPSRGQLEMVIGKS